MTRNPRRTAALLLGSVLTSLVTSSALAPLTARADPVGDARVQAAALRTRVADLQLKAEQATEAYDAAQADLGAAVTNHLNISRQLDAAQAAAGASHGQAGARVRALYMAGGSAGLYASVLGSQDLSEAMIRMRDVSQVFAGDSQALRQAGTALAGLRQAEHRQATAASTSTRLQAAVADRAGAVRSLLAQADALLGQADSQVRVLAQQQQRAADAAAAARAAAELAQLQAAARANPDVAAADPLPVGTLAPLRAGLPGPVRPGDLVRIAPGAPASPLAAAALAFARAQVGKPYVWGATGPDSYDCSGLTGASYAAAGLHLPRVAAAQWYAGPHVGLAQLQPGDLLFWATNLGNPATIHHVAMYWGGGQMLAAPHTGATVRLEPLYLDGYLGAVRPGATAGTGP